MWYSGKHVQALTSLLLASAVNLVAFACDSFAQPTPQPNDKAREEAADRLREYFEFPRRKLEDTDLERIHFSTRILEATAEHPATLFTSATGDSEFAVCNSYPVVLTASGEEWWITEMRGDNWYWRDVWTSADRSEIWAALNFHCESSNGQVVLFHSPDGGWTWRTLSSVNLGYYMHYYRGFRLAPDGKATIIATWSRDAGIFPCPIHTEAGPDGPHSDCSGLLYFSSQDGGRTWMDASIVHGASYPFQRRDKSVDHPLIDHSYVTFEELTQRFATTPGPIEGDRLPGATSLPVSRALFERATVVTRYGTIFLEIPDEIDPNSIVPYLLDLGDQDAQDGRLIKLPFSGHQWAATCGGVAGILRPVGETTSETWIVHRLNAEKEWTFGELPTVLSGRAAFENLFSDNAGSLELHVRGLSAGGNSNSIGRDIYRSNDEGRTWIHDRLEADVLVPVGHTEIVALTSSGSTKGEGYPRVISAEEADELLAIYMERAVAGLVENNAQRPAPMVPAPNIAELTSLLQRLDWHMPRLRHAAWNALGDEPGQPALHFAATYSGDSVALLNALLEAGADANVRTGDGLTALDYAVRENATDAAAFLREQPTNWGGAGDRGRTSLHWLADTTFDSQFTWDWKGTSEEIAQRALEHAQFLLDHGADPNAEDDRGQTPLQAAAEQKNSFALAQLLIEHGAEVRPTQRADVIVYGATPGGFCAAIAAAREGASVVLLEPTGHIGGVNTGGLSFSDSNQTVRSTVMGLFDEWHTRIQADYAARGVELPYDVAVKDQSTWTYEPHVAMRVTEAMLKEAGVKVLANRPVQMVVKDGSRIETLSTTNGIFAANTFVDATYEGDLMAGAGVDWTIGREGRAAYDESLAGKQYPKKTMEISGFREDGAPLPLITTTDAGPETEGDGNVMVYSFRLCLTTDPENRVPFPAPARYDPERFEAVRRYIQSGGTRFGWDMYPLPGNKFDGNNSIGGQFSLGLVGACNGWSEADAEGRRAIFDRHKQYTLAFYHFLTTDPAVPEAVRNKYAALGLCKDEFAASGHFPPQLYVRESRRMKGLHVVSQKDILESPEKDDPIAVSSFPIDSHDVQRVALPDGGVVNEGTIFPVRMEGRRHGYPYHIPYRAILPQPDECSNLLVPVALSSTHVAISSIRVEPTWMIIGQSAGIAAALAVSEGVAVQELPFPKLRERLLAQGQVLELPVLPPLPPKPEKLGAIDAGNLEGIVLDDTDAELSGTWKHSTNFPSYVGKGYLHDDNKADGKSAATFRFTPAKSGVYELHMAYSPHTTRATNVPITVVSDLMGTKFIADQTKPLPEGKHLRLIGPLKLTGGIETTVTIRNDNTNGFVILDAIQIKGPHRAK